MVVITRSQLENMSRDDLIEEVLQRVDISTKLDELSSCFEDFINKYEALHSELAISKKCNLLLKQRVTELERNAVSTSQYHRRETIEVNPVPTDIDDESLEESVCQALSLTGHKVTPDDL